MSITRAQIARQLLAQGGVLLDDAKRMAPEGEFLAYINPKEANMLRAAGGSGIMTPMGIPSFIDFGDYDAVAGAAAGGEFGGGSPENTFGGGDSSNIVDEVALTRGPPPKTPSDDDRFDTNRGFQNRRQNPLVSLAKSAGDRIGEFATGAKNYLSDPKNQRGLLANVALTSLFGPIGMLIAGLARSSRVRDALKGNKNLDTSVIDDGTIDPRFMGSTGITPALLPEEKPFVGGKSSLPDIYNQVAEVTKMQQKALDKQKMGLNLGLFTIEDIQKNIEPLGNPNDPATIDEIKQYYGIV